MAVDTSMMAKKAKAKERETLLPKEHVGQLVEWMSQGVYEKEQLIAMALLCAVAGENMFLLGPPGTAKSMVASRLKRVFKDARSFDYLMSRFSTPDEIFGPVSISRLKNEDRYERLTAGYLPEADVVFLDEIWKAGPSIQNTLLTVINEHVFYNGGQAVRTPMKVLIAASNELPAKDEGLEALWDRFLVRMVSNCIEHDAAFFKMMRATETELPELPKHLFITEELYRHWQRESKETGMHDSVVNAIKVLRKELSRLEKEDDGQLRYYVSDRRWRKAYRLMQTSAYLNGRKEIDLTDYFLLINCFWNDAECIPNVLNAFTASLSDGVMKKLDDIDRSLRKLTMPPKQKGKQTKDSGEQTNIENFVEYDYFYYLVENYPDGETYFSKFDYFSLCNTPYNTFRDAVRYFDVKRQKFIIHSLVPGQPFEAKKQNASGFTKVKIQRCANGITIDGMPYTFRCKNIPKETVSEPAEASPSCRQIAELKDAFKACVAEWEQTFSSHWSQCDNIFLSRRDLSLINKMFKKVKEQIEITEVKLNNVAMMIK